MPKIDDYIQARELSKKELVAKDPARIADSSGALLERTTGEEKSLSLNFLNRHILISWPDMEISYRDSGKGLPIQQQVLIMHYLCGTISSKEPAYDEEWISFQDLPDGRFYMGAFIKRAKDPLLKTFGQNPALLVELCLKVYNAAKLDYGDHSVMIKALPKVSLALVLWEGDDEFPPDANILFNKNISKVLSAEDIAWLSGMVIYPMIGMVKPG
ncbi:MAG: DUF3786 domain-containing protein [Deltaproteobacteria bacterium]|nr:DUF3786 domain-containing protein [Deltaproteobacteria bacterium]